MDHPDRMNGASFWPESEFSDPDLIINELFGEDIVNDNRNSTNFDSHDLQDDFVAWPSFADYSAAEVQTQKSFTPIPAARPTISTHQPGHVSNGNDGSSYVQDQGLTISPSTVDDYDNIFITPPQEQNQVFNPCFGPSSGAFSQLKTPSLDSCTTYATQTSFPSHDVHHTQDQGFPWAAGFSASNLGNLASTLHAGSKRSSMDLDDTDSRPKRAKSIKNGYPCEFDGCPKQFHRKCDSRKHFNNVHADKVHCCKLCGKGLTYPKDVTRHMKQKHGIDVPAPEEEIQEPRRRRFSSLKSVVSMLANLQLWSAKDPTESEDVEPHILVTRDHKNWRKVCLTGIESSEALMREIGRELGVHLGHADELTRCGSGGKLGKNIVRTQILAAARKAVTAGKTLEVLFTTTHDTRNIA